MTDLEEYKEIRRELSMMLQRYKQENRELGVIHGLQYDRIPLENIRNDPTLQKTLATIEKEKELVETYKYLRSLKKTIKYNLDHVEMDDIQKQVIYMYYVGDFDIGEYTLMDISKELNITVSQVISLKRLGLEMYEASITGE